MKVNPIKDLQERLDLRSGNTRTVWDSVEDAARNTFYVVVLALALTVVLRYYG